MKNNKIIRIYLSPPDLSGSEIKYIYEAFDQNWIAPLGPNVDMLEKELAAYCGVQHAAALSSGTAAIHLALIMLGVGPRDFVLCQSFTFSASANPIVYQGATPIFIDSEAQTWNMDPDLLEQAILDILSGKIKHPVSGASPLPKAIIPVHLYGMPANMERIMAIANKYGIPVIEDAAEALGSRYKEQPAGSIGTFGILSFNGNKIITTSGGGALLANNEEQIKEARFLATQARDQAPHYQHSRIGYNYRMSNIVAGIGRGQLEVIEERVASRRKNYEWYHEKLSGIEGLEFPADPGADYYSNRWLTTILIKPDKAGFNREELRLALEEENIESRPLWKPMHLQPVFTASPALINGVAEQLFEHGLCLPSGSSLEEGDRLKILEVILKIARE